MEQKELKEAEEAFREALHQHADQYALSHIQEAEKLLFQARLLVDAGEASGKGLAEVAKEKAMESSVLAKEQREMLKTKYGTQLGSSFHDLSEAKVTLERICRRINRPTHLLIQQQIEVTQTYLAHARNALEGEHFGQVSSILADANASLQNANGSLAPILERLQYQDPSKNIQRKHHTKSR
jgi:hypothetical protein